MTNCKKKLLTKIVAICVFLYLIALFVPPYTIASNKSFLHWVVVMHCMLGGIAFVSTLLNWLTGLYIAYTECDEKEK